MSHKTAMSPICAVVVCWYPDQQFGQRLQRIRSQVIKLIVVDNATRGNAAENVKQAVHADELLINETNIGVAAAFNKGIAAAESAGFTRALLLDQDTWLQDDMVAHLCRTWQSASLSEKPGVIGARFSDPSRHDQTQTVQDDGYTHVDWVISSGSLLDIALWHQLHGFREDFFIDFVDTEYCQRVRKAGYSVLQTRAMLMRHHIGAHSVHQILGHTTHTSNHSANRRYYITRNFMVMAKESRRYPFGLWIVKGILASFKSIRRVILYETDKMAKLAAIWQGWLDGIMGRMGERQCMKISN